MSQDPLQALKGRLTQLEQTLQRLASSMDEDLTVARELQKCLMPNRTPAIQGLKSHARYISAQQIASESFDILPTKDGRELWIITSWTESFGLSSVLLQALVHLQSKALVEARPKITPFEVFNEVSASLTNAKKSGGYRLMVSRVDLASLEISGTSIGSLPWLRRSRQAATGLGTLEFVQAEGLRANPKLLSPAVSAAPVLSENAYNFSFHGSPGVRLYCLSAAWAPSSFTLDERLTALSSTKFEAPGDLLADMNALLMTCQDQLGAQKREADLTALAFEVDAKKLHLA